MEGMDLSVMKETWEELAATEMRLQLMSELVKYGVGLADVENFNIDLKSNLKIYLMTRFKKNKMKGL